MTDHAHERLPGKYDGNHLLQSLTAYGGLCERWFRRLCFVLIAVIVVAAGTLLHGGTPIAVSRAFGDGFWNLIPFTLQMALIAIAAMWSQCRACRCGTAAVAQCPPLDARHCLCRRAQHRSVIGELGLSLIFRLACAEIARRKDISWITRSWRSGYLGLGCGFTLGISSSAAQLQATGEHSSLAAVDHRCDRLLGDNPDLANLVTTVRDRLSARSATSRAKPDGKDRRGFGVSLDSDLIEPKKPARPRLLEFSPVLTILIVALRWLDLQTFQSGNPSSPCPALTPTLRLPGARYPAALASTKPD